MDIYLQSVCFYRNMYIYTLKETKNTLIRHCTVSNWFEKHIYKYLIALLHRSCNLSKAFTLKFICHH